MKQRMRVKIKTLKTIFTLLQVISAIKITTKTKALLDDGSDVKFIADRFHK